jgi:hypothetical protein
LNSACGFLKNSYDTVVYPLPKIHAQVKDAFVFGLENVLILQEFIASVYALRYKMAWEIGIVFFDELGFVLSSECENIEGVAVGLKLLRGD